MGNHDQKTTTYNETSMISDTELLEILSDITNVDTPAAGESTISFDLVKLHLHLAQRGIVLINDWKPIDQAPRIAGKEILARGSDKKVFIVSWRNYPCGATDSGCWEIKQLHGRDPIRSLIATEYLDIPE